MTLEGQLEIRGVEKRFRVSGATLTALDSALTIFSFRRAALTGR
jgi:hypothetical protein